MSVEDAIRRRLALAADRHRELSALSEDPEVAAVLARREAKIMTRLEAILQAETSG